MITPITIRTATLEDEPALAAIHLATWTSDVSPWPTPTPGSPFFDPSMSVEDILVAVDGDGLVVGYVVLEQSDPPSRRHVIDIGGLAVEPRRQRTGAGRALVQAAIEAARERGARKWRSGCSRRI